MIPMITNGAGDVLSVSNLKIWYAVFLDTGMLLLLLHCIVPNHLRALVARKLRLRV